MGLAAWICAALACGQDLVAKTEALPPAEERARFKLPPGFEAQLVAAEPDIQKPMNLAFDPRGRLWVTCTVEYPWPAKERGRDTVVVLEDFGPDGRARKVTTFVDGLNIPIGVLPTRDGGALVYSIPSIDRFGDSDGDGRADSRKTILGTYGFADTHGMTSAFTRGADGWIYACHGFANASTIKAADGSELKLNSGNVYRFREDGSRVEPYTWGQVNPFGLTFDLMGDLFSADCHSRPIMMLLRGAYYVSFGKPHDGLGYAPEMCRHDHGSTGIAGIVAYEAANFPPDYRGTLFIGNPVTSKINHDALDHKGSTKLAVERPDFLVSGDPWFRPVDLELGPDGALYVADFYNRIIGHYEVPLTHPGRDRARGRIWRIVYKGAESPADRSRSSVDDLAAMLKDPNMAVRSMAAEELVARKEARGSVWVRERLGALDDAALRAAAADPAPEVRVQAMRVLSERKTADSGLISAGLLDKDPFVRRAAADAAGRHPMLCHIDVLLSLLESTPAEDTMLRHAVRMALRDQFKMAVPVFDDEKKARLLADVVAGSREPAAALYLMNYLKKYGGNSPAHFHYIARYGPPEAVNELLAYVKGGDPAARMDLLAAVLNASRERGTAPPSGVRAWAQEIVLPALAAPPSSEGWTLKAGEGPVPWVIQNRPASDGRAAVPLLSSHPRGEQLTGVVRSADIDLPAKLTFYLAGHHGVPDKPGHGRNKVRMRLSGSGEVLAESAPPRNDTAQRIEWSFPPGKRGYFEAEDGDAGDAYAWLAFGRFEPPVLSIPDWGEDALKRRKAAVELAAEFKLDGAESALAKLASSKAESDEVRGAAAAGLMALKPGAHAATLGKMLRDPAESPGIRGRVAQALAAANREEARKELASALAEVPSVLERSIAAGLAATPQGAELLLKSCESGRISSRLLQDRSIVDRLKGTKVADLDKRVAALTAGLPTADKEVEKLIAARRAGFADAKPDAGRGAAVFAKICAACHKVGDVGKAYAPQLDGVGVRGPDRLLEDILDPNRNVDAAFRTTLATLKDERVVRGQLVREEGEALLFLDDDKQEVRVRKSEVVKREVRPSSPMPTNAADLMTEPEFYDLLGFLLSRK